MENKNNISVNYTLEDDLYTIQLVDNIAQAEIGFANFKFTKNRGVWLYNIKINEGYQSNGYGKKLLKLFEDFCVAQRRFFVEGKYYPTNDHAKPFYLKNGYSIDIDGNDQFIFKYLPEKTCELEK